MTFNTFNANMKNIECFTFLWPLKNMYLKPSYELGLGAQTCYLMPLAHDKTVKVTSNQCVTYALLTAG